MIGALRACRLPRPLRGAPRAPHSEAGQVRDAGHGERPRGRGASLLIAHGADVKTVQARLRHGSAKTTLDTYGHLWPDKDESTKAVIDALVDSKFQGPADSVRTEVGPP